MMKVKSLTEVGQCWMATFVLDSVLLLRRLITVQILRTAVDEHGVHSVLRTEYGLSKWIMNYFDN